MFLRIVLFLLISQCILLNQAFSTSQVSKSFAIDSVDILHYTINLDVTNISGKMLVGATDITLTSLYPSVYGLELDLFKLNADSIHYNNALIPFSYNDTNIYFVFPQALTPQDTITLTVYYHGIPTVEPYGWGGFHFSGTSSAYNLGIAIKDLPPNYGRVWFACIDNFTERASYDFLIKVSDPLKAVCNGILTDSIPQGNGTTIYHWRLDNEIPAYLASVAISNYVAVKGIYNGLNGPIKTYIYVKPADTTKTINSFVHLNDALATFETHFGPYLWPRVGYVSTALGAMEHATNIAYPTANIDGTLASEYLYAHELSHMWFGDLVTCHSASDMWINEGWGSFAEGIFMEGVYGTTVFRNYVRVKHHDVLKMTHHKDGGYFPLSPIPASLTYGSTVYDKGAMVVHTMRGYLTSSVFFNTVKLYVDSFANKDISSIQLRDFFSLTSGINMDDFFDAWVFSPGFPHFSIDSVKVQPGGPPYNVTVYVRQKSKGTTIVSNSNRLEIGFGRMNGTIQYDNITFSGLTASKTFQLPFIPDWTGLDPNEKIADATTDNYRFITTSGSVDFPQTYCSIEATQVPDTTMVRIIHNWVAPDPFPQAVPGLTLSTSRYWTVEGMIPTGFKAQGKFSYSKFGFLDDDIIKNTVDSLVLLYRPSCTYSWQSVNFTMNGVPYQGELVVDSIMKGEYTLAIWDHDFLGISEQGRNKMISISPNPASKQIHLYLKTSEPQLIKIYDGNGAQIDSLMTSSGTQQISWSPAKPVAGLYVFQLFNKMNIPIAQVKAILLP